MAPKDFDLAAYLTDLEPLINVDCGSYNPAGVARVADLLEERFRVLGWVGERLEVGSEVGPCLKFQNRPAEHFDILLLGHMDTVFPPGTAAKRPFAVADGRAYGPGVLDMKAGLLSCLYALKSIPEGDLADAAICVAMNSDEEIGSRFSRSWIEDLARRSRVVLVTEAARLDGSMIKGRKGNGKYRIDFHGRASHAGSAPEQGLSAITELAHWILEINRLTDRAAGTGLNVGMVEGGVAVNVVPEQAHAIVDLRYMQPEVAEQVHARLMELAASPFLEGMRVSVERQSLKPPMYPTERTEALCRLVEEEGRELGIEVKWIIAGGGSDANYTAAVGTPSLDGLGPRGAGYHTPDEFLELESVGPRVALLANVIRRLARPGA